ncbi:MAG: polysaccharide lyase family 7 protein [bacterium]|nr:polysaccharide lyase family 7 protein [bacterium]
MSLFHKLSNNKTKQKLQSLIKKYNFYLWLTVKTVFILTFVSIIINFFFPKKNNDEVKPVMPQEQLFSAPAKVVYPSQVLNLLNWKITLPLGSSRNPTEIRQPELATFKIDPWFIIMPEGNAVRFRAAVNGVTTRGSDYPRSELREMANNGNVNANWSSDISTHTMFLDQAITAVPKIKQQVVAGQIHDDNKDIIVIRLDYPILHIRINGTNVRTLDSNYMLGKRFSVKFVVNENSTKVYYNDSIDSVYVLNSKYSGAYFKVGAYTQSNCSREGNPLLCKDDNYGEVVVYKVTTTHL